MRSIVFTLFQKQRRRVIMAILGVAIASSLFTAVGMLNDSLSAATFDIVTGQVGGGDIMFTSKIANPLLEDYSFQEGDIEKHLNVSEIDAFFPRVMDLVDITGRVTSYSGQQRNLLADIQTQLIICGIDDEKERTKEFGRLYYNGTKEKYTTPLQPGHCFLLVSAAQLLQVNVSDAIELQFRSRARSFIVQAIVDQEEKFTGIERNLVIINIKEAQEFLHRDGLVNLVIATLKEPDHYYNTRNLDQGIAELRAIGMQIDAELPDEYNFYMLKLTAVNLVEIIFVPLSIFYWFITIISMIITSLLIYGVMSTSSEQITYELGMLRVLGSKKGKVYSILLAQGVIVSLVGTTVGILLAFAYTPFLITLIFNFFARLSGEIPLTVYPETLLQSYLLCLGLVILVCLLPAHKAANRVIVQAVTPYRQQESPYRVVKEGSPNLRMVAVGISISMLGILLFIAVPSFIASLDFFLLLMTFLVLLLLTLIGLVIVASVLVPYIEMVLVKLSGRFARRSSHIIFFSLKRYRRRNLITTLMFSFSFTFIFFIGNQSRVLQDTVTDFFAYQYGSELVMSRTTSGEGRYIDQTLADKIPQFAHVKSVIAVRHNTLDLTLLLNGKLQELQTALNQVGQVTAGDYVNYHTTPAGLIGVPQSYKSLVDPAEILFEGGNLTWLEAFARIFQDNHTCILAKAVADLIGAGPGDTLRLTYTNGSMVEAHEIFIAGVAARLPGFWNFRQSWYSTYSGGLLVSDATYRDIMHVAIEDPTVDKIFIQTDDNSGTTIEDVMAQVDAYAQGQKYQYLLDDNYSKTVGINRQLEMFSVIMETILFFTILISLFGLFSSTQNKAFERGHEIGIIRALGMRRGEARNMFVLEACISLLSSGLLGTLIGLSLTWLIKFELTYLLEIPFYVTVPWVTVAWVFSISLAIGIFGLTGLLYKYFQKKPLEFLQRSA